MTEHLEYKLKQFFIEYFTQDNLCTAYPIYHVIKDKKKFWGVDTDYTEDWAYNCYDDSCDNWSDEGEYHGEKELCDKCYRIGWIEQTVEHGMFLLRSEAEAHLKANHYHYSDKAIVYTKHAWRSPRFERLINTIRDELSRSIKEVEPDQNDCSYPNCGCASARLCMFKNPNEAALNLNKEKGQKLIKEGER